MNILCVPLGLNSGDWLEGGRVTVSNDIGKSSGVCYREIELVPLYTRSSAWELRLR